MPQVAVERDDRVAIVTITNPPMGYMDSGTVPELGAAMLELEADESVRAVVITGGLAGVFIRHYSVAELGTMSTVLRERGTSVDIESRLPERDLDRVFRRMGNGAEQTDDEEKGGGESPVHELGGKVPREPETTLFLTSGGAAGVRRPAPTRGGRYEPSC